MRKALVSRVAFVGVITVSVSACAVPQASQDAWRANDSNVAAHLAQALSECNALAQEAITPERVELTSRLNRKQAQCMNEMRLAPETKTTYVDDGFGGLKVIDADYMAEQCSPTRADLARVEDELFRLARLPLEACMRSRGFEPR